MAISASGPLISAWAAVSPWGLDRRDFSSGLREARTTAAPLDRETWTLPRHEACLVPDFDIKQILGRKGTRSMDRATGLAVTALKQLLDDGGGGRLDGVGEDTGLALGTSTGSAQSIMSFTRDSLTGAKPYFVDPARFPNTVMNCAAGQSAIWHRLKGPNTTVAGGRATGLLALRYALRLQRAGRSDTVLCGAVEEFSAARAWLDWHGRNGTPAEAEGENRPLGEGAAVWLIEPAEDMRRNARTGLAEVLGLEFGFTPDTGDIPATLERCVSTLLTRADIGAHDVWAVAASTPPGRQGDAEQEALEKIFARHEPRAVPCADLIGDTYAASAAMQFGAVLSLAEGDDAAGRYALITSAESGGTTGAALLKLRGAPR
ncbi:3-oxoacyl-ACP synthase [Streptomyces abyssalis]|uniref:3-oxoacyl-ACP synthase n=1 Tax=Streptomyces abyssalis TaxID=933944 RepID=A0A1E7JMV0_9ACTN|nr:beta-ketoacyl synthase N-terminal-like domain-containing protein [Streptomyces abyssalis]OEU87008.1 3-oxoacyl-ACP synthase [Streptomyces abyssalis]OEU89607.1 3-oxoacyl-ACP synthase [Streptomyces abyssalis]OEV21088.1 3-oxoacyl-ACP synthase [Streptomyces nanshensis]